MEISMEKRRIYFLLYALAFGWMGGHRYYLGQPVRAVFYTLFFWTGIPWIISYIELIAYSLTSDEEFNKQYNH